MQGINLAEQGHIVNVLPPIDINGGATGDRFTMKHYGKATIIVQIGVSDVAPTIIVKECTAASGGTATAIAFAAYKEETAAGDTLGARTAIEAAGLVANAANSIFYVIDIDARQLSDGSPWIEVSATIESGQGCLMSMVAILTGARFANDQSATAIA